MFKILLIKFYFYLNKNINSNIFSYIILFNFKYKLITNVIYYKVKFKINIIWKIDKNELIIFYIY